ncbi:formate dehydrogenase [Psychromonas sp. CNPT3]|nr:formate dehydrogenase [Psychromonas sp. CNPT3]
MSNAIIEIQHAKCLLIFGYNAGDSHPIVAKHILKAKANGAKIIVCDPRKIESARVADQWLQLKNGSNMALVNALANTIFAENLQDQVYIDKYTDGLQEYKKIISEYTPEKVASITGLEPEDIRRVARTYASASESMILWGMGVTQYGQAVDVVKGLASLALITGNFGRRGVGCGPVRGQNNVQGTCDMGMLPNIYPGYQKVTDEAVREKFESKWGVPLSAEEGDKITNMNHLVHDGKMKAYYIFGEDPAQTEADLAAFREMMGKLDLVIVQDIFMTQTAAMADVIFPATSWGEHEGVYSCADRGFQRFNKAINPPAGTKIDWEIFSLMATAMGYPMSYENTNEIWDEIRSLCPDFAGATYDKMDGLKNVQWPCTDEGDHDLGTSFLFEGNKFTTENGRGQLFASEWRPPQELPDREYPLVLSTVREVGHYSCRSMTGNCSALQTLADEPGYVQMHPTDAKAHGMKDQQLLWISSRRGKVITRVNYNERINKGAVYMTYQWWIGACNELTIEHLDPITGTPEYKYCAVKVEKIEDQSWAENHVQVEYSALRTKLRNAAKG